MKAKIGALAITALMLAAVMPAVGATPYEAVTALTVGADPYQEAREKYQDALDEFLRAYAAWLNAVADWREAPSVEKAKTAMLAADNAIIKRLELLKARVELTRGLSEDEKTAMYAEIDDEISWWQVEQTDIQNVKNSLEVLAERLEMWGHWLKPTKIKILDIAGRILSAWVDAIVQKAEAFAARVEARIEELKENGVDTTDLEAWLEDYKSAIALAEEKYDEAKDKFDQIPTAETSLDAGILFLEGVILVREGNSYIKDALKALRNIVSEMRKKHTVTLSGSGTLEVEGDSSADISGTGVVKITTISIENSAMIVSPNAKVDTNAVTVEYLENGDVKYQGFSRARITGTDIRVGLSGNNVTLSASGTGSATLAGTGTYRTYGENKYVSGTLTAVSVTATLATGEVV